MAATWRWVAGSHLGCNTVLMLDLLYLFIFGKVNLCKRHRAKALAKCTENWRNFWAPCTERKITQKCIENESILCEKYLFTNHSLHVIIYIENK